MIQVEFNNKNKNPFYGLKSCLAVYNGNINNQTLNDAYNEVKDDITKKQMFYSLLFSIGDINGREHNIFHNQKVVSGGNSNREAFYCIMEWLKLKDYNQFKKFMNAGLFNEFTCFDNLFKNRVKTSKNTTKVISYYNVFSNKKYCEDLSNYLVTIIKGNNPFNKMLVAKFLTLPRLGKRSKHKQLLPDTFLVMKYKADFIKLLSDKVGWNYIYKGNYANFIGYRKWRKQYNQELESVLFSSGKIKEFDKEQFLSWLDKLPASARFRVRNKVCYSYNKPNDPTSGLKWPKQKEYFEYWEQYKEQKQAELRILEEKARQRSISEEDKIKLEKVKKEAKVNIGGTSLKELYNNILHNSIDKLKLEAFVNRIKLDYNNLVIVDESGSMSGSPFNFACFLAAACLVKNPDDDARNLIGTFSHTARLHSAITCKSNNDNRPLWGHSYSEAINCTPEPFVNPELSFWDNYKRIENYLKSSFTGGGTYIDRIPEYFHKLTLENPELLDSLKQYPVWTIISDGEWNNLWSPESSLNDFFKKCEIYFGYKPYIIAIDVNDYKGLIYNERFSGIDNFMYIPNNPETIEQILTNFKDMDVMDIYTPLQSIFRSNRYDIVRNNCIN